MLTFICLPRSGCGPEAANILNHNFLKATGGAAVTLKSSLMAVIAAMECSWLPFASMAAIIFRMEVPLFGSLPAADNSKSKHTNQGGDGKQTS